jgi:hypothetical protein
MLAGFVILMSMGHSFEGVACAARGALGFCSNARHERREPFRDAAAPRKLRVRVGCKLNPCKNPGYKIIEA